MDEALAGLASLIVRCTSLGITDDASSRELGYHGVSLACTITVVSDPNGAVRLASAADSPCLDKQIAVPPVTVHCSGELSAAQLAASTYVPLVFVAPTPAARQRLADEALRKALLREPTAAEAVAAAKTELAVAESNQLQPVPVVSAPQSATLEPIAATLAVNVALWLQKPTTVNPRAGGKAAVTQQVHITTHQSTFSADTLQSQDALARFSFTRAELSAALRELLGSSAGASGSAARSVAFDSEGEQSPQAAAAPGGSVALSLFLVNVTPLVRLLLTVSDADFSPFKAAPVDGPAPWALQLLPDDAAPAPIRHQLLSYGSLPLAEVHRHTRLFFDVYRSVSAKIRSDLSMPSQLFTSPPTAALRWELLRELDLSRLLLGDRRLVPILAVVSVTPALRYLNLDRNELSLVSAKRLQVVLSATPHRLERLSCAHNNFLESSGEELLRVIRAAKQLWRLDCDGNAFTAALSERIRRAVEYNIQLLQSDPYYVLASSHLTTWASLPAEALHAAKAVWMMLVVGEGRPFDEARRAARERGDDTAPTTGGGGVTDGHLVITSESRPLAAAGPASSASDGSRTASSSAGDVPPGLYPLEVVAPLFSQVARIVAFNIFKVISDPTIRSIFTPISALDTDDARTVAYGTSYFKLLTVAMRCVLHTPQHWDSAAATLKAVGEGHERLGVSHLYYSMANKLFVEALTTLCGEEVFTPVHKAAMVQFLALASLTALRGTETFA